MKSASFAFFLFFSVNMFAGVPDLRLAKGVTVPPDYWLAQFNVQGTGYGITIEKDAVILAGESHNHPMVAKLSPKGALIWRLIAPRQGWGRAVATDSHANIYMAGYEPGHRLRATLDKYSQQGELLWQKKIVGERSVFADQITVDGRGHIAMAGITSGRINRLTKAAGRADLFVAQYDQSGRQLWLLQLGTDFEDVLDSMVLDAYNNLYLFGTAKAAAGVFSKFVAKVRDGKLLWLKKHAIGGKPDIYSLALDNEDGMYLIKASGHFENHHRLLMYRVQSNWRTEPVGAMPETIKILDGFALNKQGQLQRSGFSLGKDIFIYINVYNKQGNLLSQDKINTPHYWDLAFGFAGDHNGNFCLTGNTHGNFLRRPYGVEDSYFNLLVACRKPKP